MNHIKLALYGFLLVFLASMLALKPYLPSAFFHNYAEIDDYKIFSNRIVKADSPGQPWKEALKPHAAPSAITQILLDDLETTALIMIENDEIVYEKYFLEGGKNEISGSFSMAKTILGLLTGFAMQDRHITSLDLPVQHWIPEWEDKPTGKITVRDLLTMSSGLNWNESYQNPFAVTAEAYYGENLLLTTLKQRRLNEHGQLFSYQSGTSQLLGLVLARATNKSLSQYASDKLWIPLGAEKDALWSLDHEEGMEKAYCCFNARARDFARLGKLILNQGKWNGKQILDSGYMKEMLTPHLIPNQDGKPTDYYGYHIWLMQTEQGIIPYARGILGQYIIMIPQKNRVVVRLGKKRGETLDHHPTEVRALVEWALQ